MGWSFKTGSTVHIFVNITILSRKSAHGPVLLLPGFKTVSPPPLTSPWVFAIWHTAASVSQLMVGVRRWHTLRTISWLAEFVTCQLELSPVLTRLQGWKKGDTVQSGHANLPFTVWGQTLRNFYQHDKSTDTCVASSNNKISNYWGIYCCMMQNWFIVHTVTPCVSYIY